MSIKLFAGGLTVALFAATAAGAAERLPFGAPSEPSVFGHRADGPRAAVEIESIDLRRQIETATPGGIRPSEPTIWGHSPATRR